MFLVDWIELTLGWKPVLPSLKWFSAVLVVSFFLDYSFPPWSQISYTCEGSVVKSGREIALTTPAGYLLVDV